MTAPALPPAARAFGDSVPAPAGARPDVARARASTDRSPAPTAPAAPPAAVPVPGPGNRSGVPRAAAGAPFA
jgi:hypothetical protein